MNFPDEIFKIISNKLLRLILDEVEDDSQLLSIKKMDIVSNFFSKYITNMTQYYETTNNIDFIIKLIIAKNIGADPNIKSYKGNTIMYLLVSEALSISYLGPEDSEYQILLDKIFILYKYNCNINIQNSNGNTVAHLLMSTYVIRECFGMYETDLIEFLQNLGMNINNIKNDMGLTAYDSGKFSINTKQKLFFYRHEYESKLNMLLAREIEFNIMKNKIKDLHQKVMTL